MIDAHAGKIVLQGPGRFDPAFLFAGKVCQMAALIRLVPALGAAVEVVSARQVGAMQKKASIKSMIEAVEAVLACD